MSADNNTPISKPLSFAERILKKHGWKSGEGLGKNSQGIPEPIKPSLKFDKTGVGHDLAEEFTSTWWNDAYTKAVDNVTIDNEQDGTVKVKWKKKSTDKKKERKDLINTKYTSFIKSATLDEGKLVDNGQKSTDKDKRDSCEMSGIRQSKTLTDDELFAACGGLTAHKGARHGHKMSGKQKRLEMQEKELMAKMKKTYKIDQKHTDENTTHVKTKISANSDEMKINHSCKKSKKKKQKNKEKHKEKKIISNSAPPSDFIEVAVPASPTNCKENNDFVQGKKIKKHKSKYGSNTEVLHGNEFVSKQISGSNKKRKAKDSDNYDSICDKKLSKEM